VEGDKPGRKKFDTYPIGFFHIDLAEVRTAEGKLYLFVAIDRTSKFAVVELVEKADMRAAAAFLKTLTPYEYLCKLWTQTPDRFTLNPIHQMPGLNILACARTNSPSRLSPRISNRAIPRRSRRCDSS
jgi:hypothetical protein